jgi:hypothetical protein
LLIICSSRLQLALAHKNIKIVLLRQQENLVISKNF